MKDINYILFIEKNRHNKNFVLFGIWFDLVDDIKLHVVNILCMSKKYSYSNKLGIQHFTL